MYSEHAVAALLRLVAGTYRTGAEVDETRGRVTVSVGRHLGAELGALPTDASLGFLAERFGSPAPPMTRAAVHVLADGRTGFGLGPTRGVIESAGDHLVVITQPEADRYTGVWRLPTIEYGGLL